MEDAVGTTHRRAWDLIPWVVNGTASAAERALVEQHLAACADCRDEFAFHQRVRDDIVHGAPLPYAAEPALARLQARLDRVEGESQTTSANDAAEPRRSRRSRWVMGLAAAVAVQSIALATMAGVWLGRDAPYQTLSRAAEAPPEAVVRLVPAPTLTLAELRALLDGSGLRIVQSSGDGAILGLAPQPGRPFAVEATIATLRRSPAVLLAEPVMRPGHAP